MIDLVPRMIGLIGVLPLFLGLGWLTWDITQDTLRITRGWRLVQLKVLETPDYETVRVSVLRDGESRELDLPRTGEFKSLQPGDELPGFQDPAKESVIVSGRGVDLWSSVGLLGFFCLFLGGVFAFLMSTRIGPPELPPFEVSASVESREDLSEFHGPARFGSALDEIVLRQAPRAWKAALFWASPGLIWAAIAFGADAGEDLWPRVSSGAAGLAWAAFFAHRALRNKSWELRFKRDRLSVTHRSGRREFRADEVKLVTREAGHPGAYRLLDERGSVILKIDGDAVPQEALTRLLQRLSEHTGKPLAEH